MHDTEGDAEASAKGANGRESPDDTGTGSDRQRDVLPGAVTDAVPDVLIS